MSQSCSSLGDELAGLVIALIMICNLDAIAIATSLTGIKNDLERLGSTLIEMDTISAEKARRCRPCWRFSQLVRFPRG